jgi:peroxiredoxin Q/BCP
LWATWFDRRDEVASTSLAASPAPLYITLVIQQGNKAPHFRRTDHKGQIVDLDELRQKGPIVLYFYPRDFTPGCTKEACMFRDAFSELEGHGATIGGVSVDDDESHRRFAQRYQLQFSLLADEDRKLAEAFGIMRTFRLLGAQRVTFVIDREGIVRGTFHHELSMQKHIEGVQQLLPTLVR